MAKMWVLRWYGIDESNVFGIVSDPKLAKEWESRSADNSAEAFEVDQMPPLEEWRDLNCFPPPPPPVPGSVNDIMMKFYVGSLLAMFPDVHVSGDIPKTTGKTIRLLREK